MNYANMEIEELESEIRACRDVLAASDGRIVSALEGLLNCTTSSAVAAYLKDNISQADKDLVSYRASIRQMMAEMQAALEAK